MPVEIDEIVVEVSNPDIPPRPPGGEAASPSRQAALVRQVVEQLRIAAERAARVQAD